MERLTTQKATPALRQQPEVMAPNVRSIEMQPQFTPSQRTSFWNRVSRSADSDSCWPWLGYRARSGYGQLRVNQRTLYAHRVAYILTHGGIPDGLSVLHHCDNPACCRPGHLFAGTHADNMQDMLTKGRNGHRTAPLRMPRGERHGLVINPDRAAWGEGHGSAKLTATEVQQIRDAAVAGESIRSLARRCPVSRRAIQFIVQGKHWNRLEASK